ncbi:Ras GTPase-activating protein, partial [Acrasis kona]
QEDAPSTSDEPQDVDSSLNDITITIPPQESVVQSTEAVAEEKEQTNNTGSSEAFEETKQPEGNTPPEDIVLEIPTKQPEEPLKDIVLEIPNRPALSTEETLPLNDTVEASQQNTSPETPTRKFSVPLIKLVNLKQNERSPSTTTPMIPNNAPTIQQIQQIIKNQGKVADDQIQALQVRYSSLKKELVLDAKQNWILEKHIETLGNKIRLLIKNHLKTEEMKNLLDTSSFDKMKKSELTSQHAMVINDENIQVYGTMFHLFRVNPQYLASLIRIIRITDSDTLLQTVIFTLFGDQFDQHEENLMLRLFDNVLTREYQATAHIGEFMRANTPFTKMLTTILKRSAYHHFLIKTLGEPINAIANDPVLNLEINPIFVYREVVSKHPENVDKYESPDTINSQTAANDPDVKQIISDRLALLDSHVRVFLTKIFASANDAPYSIRFMCKKIFQYGIERYGNASKREIYSLVGGLVFLRFINPAVTTCDSGSDRMVTKKLTSNQRKNLTYICKIIQALSNGVPFGDKEAFMVPLNSILNEFTENMYQFFVELCDVEEIDERIELDQFEAFSQESRTLHISFNEVVLMHKLCHDHINTMAPHGDDPFRALIQRLNARGPPPEQLSSKENFYFTLKLIDQERGRIEEAKDGTLYSARGDEGNVNSPNASTYLKARHAVMNTLLELPPLPTHQDDNHATIQSILSKVKADQPDRIVKMIEEACTLWDIAQNEDDRDQQDLLDDIKTVLDKRNYRKQTLETRIAIIERVSGEIINRRQYLQSQHQMYEEYFKNTMSKSFQQQADVTTISKNRRKSLNPTTLTNIGGGGNSPTEIVNVNLANNEPHVFTLSELEKKGVVVKCDIPKSLRKRVKVTISSKQPGLFVLVAQATGIMAIKSELDLNDLLLRQSRNEQEFEMQNVVLNVNLLILLLNKSFVIENNKSQLSKMRKSIFIK